MVHLGHLWHRLPASVRFKLRDHAAQLSEHTRRARVWHWNASTFASPRGVHGRVAYVGRRETEHAANEAFGDPESTSAIPGSLNGVTVSEVALPGALKVPHTLRMLIDCRGTLDQILKRGSHGAWRHVLPLIDDARVVPVTDDDEIERLSSELLTAYAEHRHPDDAVQVPLSTVRNLAHQGGLVSIQLHGEEIAARLSYEYERDGLRHFAAWRFGYPRAIYEDKTRYAAANGLNTYLSIRHAHTHGFQLLDFGLSPAHPFDNGALKYKRMHAAAVSAVNIHEFFYVKVPPQQRAWFLWVRPLFSVERGQVVLNLGVPPEVSDFELWSKVKNELAIRGVSRLRLHAERGVSQTMCEKLRSAYGLGPRAAPSDHTPALELARI